MLAYLVDLFLAVCLSVCLFACLLWGGGWALVGWPVIYLHVFVVFE